MKSKEEPPFPWIAMSFISLGMLAHSVVFTAPLPYVAFMVVDFHMTDNLDEAGYTAGWITGMFMVGRFLAGIPWGMAADKWGRKPCLFISMVNVAVFGLIFGFSTNFPMAVTMRFIIGLGNGFMGVAKTSITEFVETKEHEVRAFGYLNGIWGLGLIVGPAIGGLLARPAVQYPHAFSEDGLWGHYPYLLPSLVCACIAVLAGVGILFFMPETLGKKTQINHHAKAQESTPEQSQQHGDYEGIADMDESTGHAITNDEENQIELTNTSSSSKQNTESLPSTDDSSYGWSIQKWKEVGHYKMIEQQDESEHGLKPPKKLPSSLYEILTNKQIQFIFCVYLSYCFIIMFVDESFPLWCVTKVNNGGLDWESAEVGETLASIGFGLVIFQIFFYEAMIKKYFNEGPVETYHRLLQYTAVFIAILPIVSDLTLRMLFQILSPHFDTKSNIVLRLAIVACWLCYRIPATAAFSTLAIVVNASVDSSMRGTMNGLIMTAGSLGNGAGPVVGSALYALALNLVYGDHIEKDDHRAFVLPVDGRIIFIIGGLLTILLGNVALRYMKVD